MSLSRFQKQVTTGRLTFPVVILICLLLWCITFQQGDDLISLGFTALTGYLLFELNTAFTLIRTRTTFHIAFFWYLIASLPFLHSFHWTHSIPLLFMLSVHQLFASYESHTAPKHLFHCYLFLGIGSLVFPKFLYYVPLFFLSTIPFRSLSIKGFLGSLLGLATPYWFLFGHAYWHDQMSMFYQPFEELVHLGPITYSFIPAQEWISWIITTLLLIGYIFHYLPVSFQDKNRTRIYMSFLVIASLWTTALAFLQPQHLSILWPIQLIGVSFLAAHSFTLTRNSITSIYFLITFVVLIVLTCYNLWMLFFNF